VARLDGGDLLEFSEPPSTCPDDPSLCGRHVGGPPVSPGALSGVVSRSCSLHTEVPACATGKDFTLQRVAG
jgi:hypothetical protein